MAELRIGEAPVVTEVDGDAASTTVAERPKNSLTKKERRKIKVTT